ncbi:hypothetical protein AX774_g5734 [Zancudomyces culisetae]|uniref:Yeast cell wall synthesis Kre9/Knh1-like N-terminal domain-containing protein n=1 Tax=Zancudomyces culisetae TaxID=1213189 RepID=A0A1R1PDQ6_ZANCU|nr:hypothetical protein AX774_g7599 [Zancudomyces culisetae]OMH80824.1 hypothetical protein AX774_g5734 [Zancudomyces culisetae]|eukprot:OMH79002.1 hypothetical protein AX774_g7599 [Zancudomyces culisetae]
MKSIISAVAILASLTTSFAALVINSPLQSTKWNPGGEYNIVWSNSLQGAPLSGNLVIDLMEGADSNNLNYITTLCEQCSAAQKKFKYAVPSDFPYSRVYSIRITDEDGNASYSPQFQGGSPTNGNHGGQAVQQSSGNQSGGSQSGGSQGGAANQPAQGNNDSGSGNRDQGSESGSNAKDDSQDAAPGSVGNSPKNNTSLGSITRSTQSLGMFMLVTMVLFAAMSF